MNVSLGGLSAVDFPSPNVSSASCQEGGHNRQSHSMSTDLVARIHAFSEAKATLLSEMGMESVLTVSRSLATHVGPDGAHLSVPPADSLCTASEGPHSNMRAHERGGSGAVLRMQCEALAKRNASLSDRVAELEEALLRLRPSFPLVAQPTSNSALSQLPSHDACSSVSQPCAGVGGDAAHVSASHLPATFMHDGQAHAEWQTHAQHFAAMETSWCEGRMSIMMEERGALIDVFAAQPRLTPAIAPKDRTVQPPLERSVTKSQGLSSKRFVKIKINPLELR